jgi:hypothetical protein
MNRALRPIIDNMNIKNPTLKHNVEMERVADKFFLHTAKYLKDMNSRPGMFIEHTKLNELLTQMMYVEEPTVIAVFKMTAKKLFAEAANY